MWFVGLQYLMRDRLRDQGLEVWSPGRFAMRALRSRVEHLGWRLPAMVFDALGRVHGHPTSVGLLRQCFDVVDQDHSGTLEKVGSFFWECVLL